MKLKLRLLGSMLMSTMLLMGMVTTVFASEQEVRAQDFNEITIDMNEFNYYEPFSETKTTVDEKGMEIAMTLSYEPTTKTRGSSTNTASVGTWTSKVDYGVIQMSYKFDLSKSGSQWRISNGREHSYSGLFCSFSNNKLSISRAISTNTYACEINARVDASVCDNKWFPLYSGTWLMTTRVNHSGTMTLSWN